VWIDYNTALCKIAWARVGLWRVFWCAQGAALWLLSSYVGFRAVAAKANVVQEGRAKNVTQKGEGRVLARAGVEDRKIVRP
jgi:hypothetical protein